jgi:hypothetical protein
VTFSHLREGADPWRQVIIVSNWRLSGIVVLTFFLDWYSDITLPFAKSMVNLGIPINFNPVGDHVIRTHATMPDNL